jgi:hypothetical protein
MLVGRRDIKAYIAGEQRVHGKCASLTLIVRVENDADVFDRHNNRQRPDDEREGTKKVVIAWRLFECGGVDIERACANITVDDPSTLKSKTITGGLDQSTASRLASAYISNFHPWKICL